MKKKKVKIENRSARRDYKLFDKYEAGIVLQGSEVKSVKLGQVDLKGSYCKFINSELYVIGLHIAHYEKSRKDLPTRRPRKLLLHKHELKRLHGLLSERGFTLVPLSIYINERGFVKLEIALARGRKKHEKKEYLKQREIEREMEYMMRRRR